MSTDFLPLTFILLAFSIASVWLPRVRLGSHPAIPVWPIGFVAAILSGLYFGHIKWPALISIGTLALAAHVAASDAFGKAIRIAVGMIAALLALALALHLVPGFNNPILIKDATLSPGATLYTQYANFDKASVGLLLVALLCRRAGSWEEWRDAFRTFLVIAVASAAVIIALAFLLGFVRFAPKSPSFTLTFLVVNLFFVCVAEEAFFRGFLQDRLERFFSSRNVALAGVIAMICAALLYALAHLGAGPGYMLLAFITGLGFGYTYLRTHTIEASIAAHFLLNAVHFIGFTYPKLA